MIEVFRAGDTPAAERMDHWYQVLLDKCGPHELQLPDGLEPVEQLRVGAAGAVRIDDLLAARTLRADRSARQIRRDVERGMCKLHVLARGRVAVQQNGREAMLAPGDFVLVDDERPVAKLMTTVRFVTLVFPKVLLPFGPDGVRELSGLRFDGNAGLGGLASSFVRQLARRLDTLDEAEAARLGTTVLDLLTMALATRLDRDDALPPGSRDSQQRALLARIHSYIEEHLSDPDLSPLTLAAANHVSVRYLHRLFETQETTVAVWIRRRRLERCRRDLADPTMRAWPVSAVAARWGLTNPTHFGRQFRAQYGLLPTEYRQAALN